MEIKDERDYDKLLKSMLEIVDEDNPVIAGCLTFQNGKNILFTGSFPIEIKHMILTDLENQIQELKKSLELEQEKGKE